MTILLNTDQLNKRQLKDLDKLMQLCVKKDGGTPPVYRYLLEQKRETKNIMLCYRNDRLIGFLSVYFFYEDACEISLIVAPSFRRQGIARRMYKAIKPLILARRMKKLIFSMSASFEAEWLKAWSLEYQQSEYQMQRMGSEKQPIPNPRLTLRKAGIEDLDVLKDLDMACFPKQAVDMDSRLNYLLGYPKCTILLALEGETIIGKTHLHQRENKINFSDIAVYPAFQGKGYGGELLAACINRVIDSGKTHMILDVEVSNQGALNLYKRQGFSTVNSYHYWVVGIEDFKI